MMFHGDVTARQLSEIVPVERMELPRELRGVEMVFPGQTRHLINVQPNKRGEWRLPFQETSFHSKTQS